MYLYDRVSAALKGTVCLRCTTAVLFLLPVCSSTGFAQWTYMGLGNRPVGEIKIFGDTIYAGTDDGVFKHSITSTDTIWLPVGLPGKVIRTLLVRDYNEIWAIRNLYNTTDSALLYKTTDAGKSWSVLFTSRVSGSGNPTDNVFDILDGPPSSRDTAFFIDVGVQAIYRTTDGGSSWSLIHDIHWRYRFIKINPVRQNQMWFGGEGLIFNPILYESTDYGSTWQEIDLGMIFAGDNACHTLAFHPPELNTWYVPGEGKVVKTTDSGLTWSVIYENSFYDLDMAVSPARSDFLYVLGGPYLLRSMDAGLHWDTLAHAGFDASLFQLLDLEVVHRNETDVIIVGGTYGVHRYDNSVTGVKESSGDLPVSCRLEQNCPNPFNPATDVRYMVRHVGHVSLKVYDVLGRMVATLVDQIRQPGEYTVTWDAEKIPSGIYYCRMISGNFTSTRKMVLIR